MKTHFQTVNETYAACGRPAKRMRTNVREVDCLNCKKESVYVAAKAAADLASEAIFWAQTPRKYSPQFGSGLICECGSDLFRYKGRSCYGHYDDYKCAGCGKDTSRLTETGMCF